MVRKPRKPRSWAEVKRDPRVASFSDERGWGNDPGDGLWLYLAYPWWSPTTDLTCVHEYTVKDVIDELHNCRPNHAYWEAEDPNHPAVRAARQHASQG